MMRVADAVRDLGLPAWRLERLGTAVAEATTNAMEHGNGYRSDLLVHVQVLAAPDALFVRIGDDGIGPIAEPPVPDLAAKLSGQQAPRGWGLFLIRNLVDDLRIGGGDGGHTVELVLRLDGSDLVPRAAAMPDVASARAGGPSVPRRAGRGDKGGM
jgi:anti-sigma regulatory factor (Ser/Thr protein kinase)